MDKLCSFSNIQGYNWEPERPGTETEQKIKSVNIRCPVCKRKLKSAVRYDIHGFFLGHFIPKHKVKKWWKKNKRK